MAVAVELVGKMPVRMQQRQVPVRMTMPRTRGDRGFVRMLVVFVVAVFVIMENRRVGVFMLMALGQVQPGAKGHQGSGSK